MKIRFVICLSTLFVLAACNHEPSVAQLLKKSFDNLNDSLLHEGYTFHQEIDSIDYPESISTTIIKGNTTYSSMRRSDTVFMPNSLKITGQRFKKERLTTEYYQFYFSDTTENAAFNQFLPFSQFLLANNKTPGTYFMYDAYLYLEYHPFP